MPTPALSITFSGPGNGVNAWSLGEAEAPVVVSPSSYILIHYTLQVLLGSTGGTPLGATPAYDLGAGSPWQSPITEIPGDYGDSFAFTVNASPGSPSSAECGPIWAWVYDGSGNLVYNALIYQGSGYDAVLYPSAPANLDDVITFLWTLPTPAPDGTIPASSGGGGDSCPVYEFAFLVQPVSVTSLIGGYATFALIATGKPTLFYQWYFCASGALGDEAYNTGEAIAGATGSDYTACEITASSLGSYYCVVLDGNGSSNYSNVVTLTASNAFGAGGTGGGSCCNSSYELVIPAIPKYPLAPGYTDTQIALPCGLRLADDPYSLRETRATLALADGAQVDGGQVEAREITLEGCLHFPSRAVARQQLLALRGALYQPNLCLIVDQAQFVNLRKLKDFQAKPVELTDWHCWDVQITWTAADPYWYLVGRQTVDYTFAGSGVTNFALDNSSSPGVCPIVITMTAPSGNVVAPWTLTNNTDGGLSCRWSDLGLVGPEVVTIDSTNGTAVGSVRGNLISVLGGTFLRLLPGLNSFTFAGGVGQMTLTWWLRSP